MIIITNFKFKRTLLSTTIFTLFFVFIVSEGIYRIVRDSYIDSNKKTLQKVVEQNAQLIQDSISKKIYTLNTLSAMLTITDYDIDGFDTWAPSIFASNPGLSSIQIAPDGVVSKIYPLEGNEKALGHDLLKDNRRKQGALDSIQRETISFIGPVKLIQKDKDAIICRKPLFKLFGDEKKFWGFVTVIITMDDLKIQNIIDNESYNYRISGYNPDSTEVPIVYQNCNYDETHTVCYPIFVPGGYWKLLLWEKKTFSFLPIHIMIHVIGLIIGIIYLIKHYHLVQQSKKIHLLNVKLEKLTYFDDLTLLYNRRGIYRILKDFYKEGNNDISVAILDLNSFKVINDTYGHKVGDEALKHLAKLLQLSLGDDVPVGRTGGDEFLCVFKNMPLIAINMLLENLELNLQTKPLIYKGQTFTISSSIGVAHYTGDESLEKLIERADMEMYQSKKVRATSKE